MALSAPTTISTVLVVTTTFYGDFSGEFLIFFHLLSFFHFDILVSWYCIRYLIIIAMIVVILLYTVYYFISVSLYMSSYFCFSLRVLLFHLPH